MLLLSLDRLPLLLHLLATQIYEVGPIDVASRHLVATFSSACLIIPAGAIAAPRN